MMRIGELRSCKTVEDGLQENDCIREDLQKTLRYAKIGITCREMLNYRRALYDTGKEGTKRINAKGV